MSEWQDIRTAPVGLHVELGWWETHYGDQSLNWRRATGAAKEKVFLGITKLTYDGKRASHWRYLPEPPK